MLPTKWTSLMLYLSITNGTKLFLTSFTLFILIIYNILITYYTFLFIINLLLYLFITSFDLWKFYNFILHIYMKYIFYTNFIYLLASHRWYSIVFFIYILVIIKNVITIIIDNMHSTQQQILIAMFILFIKILIN